MTTRAARWFLCLILIAGFVVAGSQTPAEEPAAAPLSEDQFLDTMRGMIALQQKIVALKRSAANDASQRARVADVDIFAKGVMWALMYDKEVKSSDVALLERALKHGHARADALAAGNHPWTERRGRLVLGYVSDVDNSTQPFGLVMPAGYDPKKPMRLDVVLHGSTRPVGFSELRFMNRFDADDEQIDTSDDAAAKTDYIELHPLGRVENCYRWAGETDVLEAIEAVCARYLIDRDRIVLRGMSMGASGTWHLGLKHPDRFVALGPYCGYVDTHRMSETPLANFVRVGPLPPHQEIGLHMLDSVDYAANAGVVPVVACIGEKDVFFDAHVLMGAAMRREGLQMVNLISPGTGHVIDPVTHAEQMRQIGIYAARGIDHAPRRLRFVTWTLKYSRCHWLQVMGLKAHYQRAEVMATADDDGNVEVTKATNITRLAVAPPMLQKAKASLHIEGAVVSLPPHEGDTARTVVVARDGDAWRALTPKEAQQLGCKRPGLQGPIDDAFTTRFLCVRGTGQPWNPKVGAYADAALDRFADTWRHYFRGHLPRKDDVDVTDDDLRRANLILFGDGGSNRLIARVLPHLPLMWDAQTLTIGGQAYSSAEHVPVLIQPNPLPGGAGHYIVLNSGHTFQEAELASINYLLFPRLGDWAVLKADPARLDRTDPTVFLDKAVVQVGYCDEQWGIPAGAK